MKKFLLALAMASALYAPSAIAQEKLKIGATVYGLNAEFMQIWSAALQKHPAVGIHQRRGDHRHQRCAVANLGHSLISPALEWQP